MSAPNNADSETLVSRAKLFATQAHRRIDQRRKYSRQPYEVHLKAVADTIASVSDDPEMVAAAWLHDTVEDTPATIEDIEREFGSGVAELVSDLTDVSRPGDGNRAVRKALDRAHIARASTRAKTVKLADLIDNCRDICHHDERFARIFLVEMQSLLEVLGDGDARLLKRAHKALASCAEKLSMPLSQPLSLTPADVGHETTEWLKHFRTHQQRTLHTVMRIFTAQDIAEPLRSFDKGLDGSRIAASMDHQGVQVAAVREHGAVAGYVQRAALAESHDVANEQPRSFRPDQVVDGSASLADVVLILTRHDFCFVRVLGEIVGVIGRGDMQKPLVRMWLFGFVTSSEMLMRERLLARWPGSAWVERMPAARLEKANALLEERRRRGQDCQLLDCVQVADVAKLLMEDPGERRAFGFESKAAAKRVIKEFESLRNNLAHAQDIVSHDWTQIARMAQNMEVQTQNV